MEELRVYLNQLTPEDQAAYAAMCGTTVGYLRKLICVSKKKSTSKKKGVCVDAALCRLLDEHSGGVVRKELLRPDVWPELLERAA